MIYKLVPCANGHITCFNVNSTNEVHQYSETDFLVYPLVTSTTGEALPNNNTARTILSHTLILFALAPLSLKFNGLANSVSPTKSPKSFVVNICS
jgi:hypothetical protein